MSAATRAIFLIRLLAVGFLFYGLTGAAAARQVPPPTDTSRGGVPEAYTGKLALVILAGQSNMSGRGALPAEASRPHPRVFVFGNDYRWRAGTEPVDDPRGQVDSVSYDASAGLGAGVAFAEAFVARHPGLVVGLIPCARGGTGIAQWQRNHSDRSLYGSCLKRVRAASPMGTAAGLLFFQGESDAVVEASAAGFTPHPDAWAHLFTTFVNDFRQDLQRPALPVVFAQLGPQKNPARYAHWQTVREEQAGVRLPHASMIRTDDIALRDDVHFDAPSYQALGRRFADALTDLWRDSRDRPGRIDLQGHRGARGLAPENTLPAFRRALALGVTTLELDLAITRDGRVVVSHEPWFSSAICATPDGRPITEAEEQSYNLYAMTYAEAAAFDCGRRGNERFPEQEAMPAAKPLLDSVFVLAERYVATHARDPVRYNVEIKTQEARDGRFHPPPAEFARRLYAVLERHGVLGRTTVQSFDPRALAAMRALDASVPLAFLVDNDLGLEANLARLDFTPAVYSPHYRLVDAGLVAAVHARGMQLIPWTVNEVAAMQALLTLGVDGLITDYPDRGRAVVDALFSPADGQAAP